LGKRAANDPLRPFAKSDGIQMNRLALLLTLLTILPMNTFAKDPEIVGMSPNIYMITRASKAGMFTNVEKLKIKVIDQANDFAASKGKVVVLISQNFNRPFAGWPTFEYVFQLVDEDEIDEDGNLLEDADEDESFDVYTEILKLDELRNRGLLTDEEFEKEKQKILDSN